jgi:hypothetical protein
VELGVCPCNFTHVSPRALAKWSSTVTNKQIQFEDKER